MRIACLIITYEPNILNLKLVLKSISNQVDRVVVVDNGSTNQVDLLKLTSNSIFILPLMSNFGIAKATNIGISYLSNENIDFLLLSDQDTIYDSNYILYFKSQYINDTYNNSFIAYAPKIFDKVSNTNKSVYILKNNRIVKKRIAAELFQTIASGLIIDYHKLLLVGGMNESLFIDMVDFEWCWKIYNKGYKIKYLPSLMIFHSLGDSGKLFFGKWIALRSVNRYYYLIRNTIYLSLYTTYLSPITKFFLFITGLKYFFGYNILTHGKYIKLLFSAVFHGVNKKLGKLEI